MKIIFLGAPGSGKGTQSSILSKELSIPTISTGDIIRGVLKSGSEQASLLKSYIDKGALVPDDLVVNLLKNRLAQPDCANGYILDGFPRTIDQAEILEKMNIIIDLVINIEVDDDIICKRMLNRVVCSTCGAVFNNATEMKPIVPGICDKCAGSLVQRSDDNESTIKNRLKVYRDQTSPLIDYYDAKGILHSVDGSKPLKDSSGEILKLVKSKC